jgi:PAS domain S-box-containing protein
MMSSDTDSLEALLQSEARLKRAELITKCGNWEIHLDTQILYNSEGASEIYGLSGKKHDLNAIVEMYLPPYREQLETARRNLVEKNISYDVEFKIKTADKGIIKHIHSIAFYDPSKRIIFGVIQDVTEIRKIEDNLKSNYSLLRIAGKTARFGGWSVDLKENELHWSDEVAEIHEMPRGYSPTVEEGINFYAPGHRDKIQEVFNDCIKNGIPYDEVMQIITSTGKLVWVRTTGEALRDNTGRIISVVGSFQDINHIKKAEENLIESEAKFRNLFEHAADAILIIDISTGIIQEANHAASHLLSMPYSKIIGLNQSKLHPNADQDFFHNHIKETFKMNSTPPQSEGLVVRSDGSHVPVDITSARIRFNGRDCLRVTFRDITLRKLEEQKLILLNNQLKELNATKDKMFSIIAHDLINPFNSIIGFSDLLKESISEKNSERSAKFINVINVSARNTLILLENLLSWAKTQTGKVEFNPEKIGIIPVIKEIFDVAGSSALIKNITLECLQKDDIIVYADRNMLKTIIRNLVSNAIKFTNPGGKIKIEISRKKDFTDISVSDNGVGMNEEILRKLFSLESGSTTLGTANEKGSGLGLIICKEFIERHNGKLTVESKPGRGSRFIITLPTPVQPD